MEDHRMTAAKTQLQPEMPAVVHVSGTDSNGCRVFLVPSVSGSMAAKCTVYHAVTLEETRMRCNCAAATFGRICSHQHAVTDHLLREVNARLERADACYAPAPGAHAAPHRDNRPFSMWK
jgi:hypothetical protein